MAWNPGKTWNKIKKDPAKVLASTATGAIAGGAVGGVGGSVLGGHIMGGYEVGGKNEKEFLNKWTGGLASKGDKIATDVSQGFNQILGKAIDQVAPATYNPGSHTIDRNPFQGGTYTDYIVGFGDLARQSAGRGGPQINMRPQGQFREGQQQLAQQLAQQAAGQGPSLATLQMQQNTDDAIRSAMAIAASGRSGTAGGRLKQAQDQAAMLNQQGARDSAMMRIQEQLAARDQLAGVLGQGRQGDIGLATGQADLDMRQGILNDQTGLAYDQMQMNAYTQQQAGQQNLQKLLLDQYLAQEQLKQQGIASENAMKGGLISGLGQAAFTGIALSDKNAKKNIKDGDGAVKDFLSKLSETMGIKKEPDFAGMPEGDRMKEFMSRIKSYEYDYKDPANGEGKRVSPMAQDLEQDPLGAALVSEREDGLKQVDYGKAGGMMLAGLATLSQENDELRAMVEKLAKKRGA